ncbi:MAG: hypothetical protein ACE5OY_03225 [Candidatus Bathyarchaeia archaeon]
MKFLLIGLGHCGGKIADDFVRYSGHRSRVSVSACAINTDLADLVVHRRIPADNRLCVGSRRGAAKDWERGRGAAAESRSTIARLIERLLTPDTDVVMLTLGEGGGTGSGMAPVVAEIIGELGAECMALTTLPFDDESVKVKVNAAKGLDLLYRQDPLKSLICIDNEKITARFPERGIIEAYRAVNEETVHTFLDIVRFAHAPSKGDRIDESEIITVLGYEGFATLCNLRVRASEFSDLSGTVLDSWARGLFAEVDVESATGGIVGLRGPAHLFTTVKVDGVRGSLRESMSGKDIMLGVYRSKRSPWLAVTGILAGMDVPSKIRGLLDLAKREYLEHAEVMAERRELKRRGLGFDLGASLHKKEPIPRDPQPLSLGEAVGAPRYEEVRDLVLRFIKAQRVKRLALEELVVAIKAELGIPDEDLIHQTLEDLKYLGYLMEPERGYLQAL